MTSRRDRGSGSIFERKDGKWVASIEITDGRMRRRRRKKVCATKAAAKLALRDLELHAGRLEHGNLTVGAWLTTWLESPSAQRKPSTQRSYTQTARDHVRPFLEHRPLASLTVPVLQQWLDDLVRAKRTPRVVQMARAVLRASLTHAVRFGHLEHNPALYLQPPKTRTRKIRTATADELDRLASAGPPWFAAWLFVTVALGLRRGESLGLWWDDFEWTTGVLEIKRTILDGGQGTPKTDSSRRAYTVPPVVFDVLRHHRRRVELEAMMDERDVSPWIFGTRTGTPMAPRNLARTFYAARTAAKLGHGLRIHDLRHTAGTILLTAGTDPKTIAAWLGHADVQTTLRIYTQTSPGLHLVAGQQMQKALPKPNEN